MTSANPDPNRRNAGSTPDDAGNGTKQKIKDDARDVKREASSQAREKAKVGKHRIADEADNLSDAIDAAASNLDDHDRDGLARYARELSSNLANAAGQLEGRSVDELASDAKRLARNNPALFMLGTIAVGFGLSRFFKASAEHDHQDDAQRADAPRNNAPFGNNDASIGTPAPQRGQGTKDTYKSPTAERSGNGSEML
ncbi:MAG: hypothetical protein WD078_02845 [Woeseia sp.]